MSGTDKPVFGERIALQNVGNRQWSDQISGQALGKDHQNRSVGQERKGHHEKCRLVKNLRQKSRTK